MSKTEKHAPPQQQPNPLPQRWFTVEEAASYLRVSHQTIRNILHSGQLKAARVGARFRIAIEDLDDFLARSRRAVAPYRRGTRPWVARRHAANRKRARAR
jgi:excisionase family DNA binding protein